MRQEIMIGKIPALLWGPASEKILIAVHGDQSHKADTVIELVAAVATAKGWQVLSFDLPEHGERKQEGRLCDPQNCREDLEQIMAHGQAHAKKISLFGCSIGAYFSLLAYQERTVQQALLLSPVVDMKRLIENMMLWFDVSAEGLEKEREVVTPVKTLYWHYYQYVLQHPIKWRQPTAVLYGAQDELCEYEYVKKFVADCQGSLTVLDEGEHFFHTEQQLTCLREWLQERLLS